MNVNVGLISLIYAARVHWHKPNTTYELISVERVSYLNTAQQGGELNLSHLSHLISPDRSSHSEKDLKRSKERIKTVRYGTSNGTKVSTNVPERSQEPILSEQE